MKKKILFFYIEQSNWLIVEPVYKWLLAQTWCDLTILLVKTLQLKNAEVVTDISLPLSSPKSDYLDSCGYYYIKDDNFEWDQNTYDLLVLSYPYDDVFPEKFNIQSIKRNIKKLFYIPYGIEFSYGGMMNHTAYNLPIHHIADGLISQSESTKNNFIKHNKRAIDRIYATGLPRFDELATLDSRQVNPQLKQRVNHRFCILWNTHYSFVINRWSCFDRMIYPLIEFVKAYPNAAVIMRHHPNLEMILVDSGFCTRFELDLFFRDLEQIGFIVDRNPSHLDAFALSDCFITDGSSLFVEYLGTEKPMALIQNPDLPFDLIPDVKNVLKLYDSFTEPEDVIKYLISLMNGVDPKKRLRPLVNSLITPPFDGGATQRVGALIADLLEINVEY